MTILIISYLYYNAYRKKCKGDFYMDYKRILTIQDISCVGQCSLTVALPIIVGFVVADMDVEKANIVKYAIMAMEKGLFKV